MLKKVVKLLVLVTAMLTMLIGCSNTKDVSTETSTSLKDSTDNIEVTKNILDSIYIDTKYENYKEFKKESKNNIIKFSKLLSKNNIENVISKDGYSVKNTNTVHNQNNINYNRIVSLSTSLNVEGGEYFYGSYNVNLIYENHIQEEYKSDNEFIKLVYDVVKGYNEDLTIDELAKELNDYVNDDTDTISFSNDIVKIHVSNENTIKKLSMSFENSISRTVLDSPVKEYSTMKEFIEDSNNLANRIKEKSSKIIASNMVEKEGREIKSYAENNTYMTANFDGDLYQEINIDLDVYRNSESAVAFTDNTIKVIYSILEEVYGEQLKEYYTFEEFLALVQMNTVKNYGDNELYDIEPMELVLPYLHDGYIRIDNNVTDKEILMEDIIYGNLPNSDKLEVMLESFNENILTNGCANIVIRIPVKAEGLTKYYPQYQDEKYVLDDGTIFEKVDTRQ